MTTPTKTITLTELTSLLSSITHAAPIGFSALVDARARKTANPYGQIRKLSKVTAFTGMDYAASVQRQQVREGQEATFEASERSWGVYHSPALVRHETTGELYLRAKVQATAKPIYLYRASSGLLTTIDKSKVAPYLPAPRKAVNQGVANDVIYRNYALANLTSIQFNGCRYRIRH